MEVITIESSAFLSLKEQLNRIEGFIERTSEVYLISKYMCSSVQ